MTEYKHTQSVEQSIDSFVEKYLHNNLNTAIPGFIESFDIDSLTAEVSVPIVEYSEAEDGTENEEDWPKLADVPVCFPGGKDSILAFPLVNGTPILLVFCQRDIAAWFVSDGKEPLAPEFSDDYSESAAICIPRLHPEKSDRLSGLPDDAVVLAHKDTKLIIQPNGDVVIDGPKLKVGSDSASTPVAKGPTTQGHLTTLATRVTILSAIVGLDPIVLTESVNSGKILTND